MTTPNGDVPSGSLGTGQFAEWQAMTEEDAKAQMRAPLSSFQNAQDNEHAKWGGFLGIGGFLEGLTDAFTGGSDGGGFFSGIFNKQKQVEEKQVVLETRIEQLEGGGTRTIYYSNFTWTNPGPGHIVYIEAFNGGQAGYNAGSASGTVAKSLNFGGRNGGYIREQFNSEDLPASVSGVVGIGGASNGALGGVSSFGSYVVCTSGIGTIITPTGAYASTSVPGDGGNGRTYGGDYGEALPPTAGGPSALATGGAAGTSSTNGGVGGAPSSDPLIVSGGGGGGGGWGAVNSLDATRGKAGAGGVPGGGGGGGGYTSGGGWPQGAPGGSGAIAITVKERVDA